MPCMKSYFYLAHKFFFTNSVDKWEGIIDQQHVKLSIAPVLLLA
jgi:hypothetical protein